MNDFINQAAHVVPSKRQMDWFALESYAFVHFGVDTFTDREWGLGTEEESIFNPTELNCDKWVEAIKSAGMKGMVLTAKHHDGFCLWPSKYTEHSVKNSPFKGDVVKLASEACKKGGIKFGVYLSPWDRNSKYYGTPEYNDYFCNQLTELLTQYGEIFYVWFDNACGEGPNGIKQEYDFKRYFELIRKYQPNAVIFNDYGPDVRWCGNEAGVSRHSEWSVVPNELCFYAPMQTDKGPWADNGTLSYMYNNDNEIGTLPNILYSKGLSFVPSEINMSLRPGWFWHENEDPHSLERLFKTYLTSVGSNASFNLNVPPDRRGLIDDRDIKRLKEFGDLLKKEFGTEIPCKITDCTEKNTTQAKFEIALDISVNDAKYIVIEEDIEQGQRVESFRITLNSGSAYQYPIYQGTCIGHKKICQLQDPFKDQNPLINDLSGDDKTFILQVTASRDVPVIKSIKVY